MHSLKARWVLPLNGPPIDGGVVTIAEGRIAEVGRYSSGSSQDLGDVVLMPGLVNAHTHLEFSELSEPMGNSGMVLSDWIRLVIADRNRVNRDATTGVAAGIAESLRNGVTTIGDIATTSQAAYETKTPPEIIAFQEVIGFSTARIQSVLADINNRISSSKSITSLGISPHAPYTVHPQLLEQLVSLAAQKNLPVAMHLAESHEELQLLRENTGPFRELLEERSMWDPEAIPIGSSPLSYLQKLAASPCALVIHGNYLDGEEIRFLAKHREHMSVVYCPRTHAYFEHEPYPLQKILQAGARVVLGTDSRASNPNLSLLEEMRYVFRQHSGIRTEDVLAMGTSASAQAIGRLSEIGTIRAGKLANLIAVPCDANTNNPAEHVLSSVQPVSKTWVRGKLFATESGS